MNAIQLEFFRTPEECELDALRQEIKSIKESSDKVRKKCFAEIGKYSKVVNDLSERLQIIERNICRENPEKELSFLR